MAEWLSVDVLRYQSHIIRLKRLGECAVTRLASATAQVFDVSTSSVVDRVVELGSLCTLSVVSQRGVWIGPSSAWAVISFAPQVGWLVPA